MGAFGTKPNKSLFAQSDALNKMFKLGNYADPSSLIDSGLGSPGGVAGKKPGLGQIDYKSLIANDPLFGQAQGDFKAADISDRGQLLAALKRAAIGFGESVNLDSLGIQDPEMKSYLGGAFDEGTQGLIKKSSDEGLSLMSRLAKANKDAIRNMKNALASRGMLQSGELTHGLSEEGLNYKQAGFDARQALLEQLSSGIGGYLERVNERKRAEAQARQEAADRQLALLGSSPGSSAPAQEQPWERALRLRSEAMNKRYGLGG